MTGKSVSFDEDDIRTFNGIASDVIELAESLKAVTESMSERDATVLMNGVEESKERLDTAYHMLEDVLG